MRITSVKINKKIFIAEQSIKISKKIKKYKISIIVPNLNNVKYLNECLESIKRQSLKDIECICVDCGSDDGSLLIIKEFTKKDKRFKLIIVDKKSYGYQMNVGIKNAKGEYIGIVESDDFVDLNMFQDLYTIASVNDCEMVKSDFYRFKTNKDCKIDELYIRNYVALDKTKKYYNRVVNTSQDINTFFFPMNTWSGIYKKSFIDKFKIFHNESPGASYQDNGFFFQTFMNCTRAYFTNKAYYMNRRDNENSSVFSKGKMFAMTKEYDFIKKYIDDDPARKVFNKFFFYKKFQNYLFTYNRLDEDNKKIYYKFIRKEFEDLINEKKLDTRLFSKEDLRNLLYLVDNEPKFKQKFG